MESAVPTAFKKKRRPQGTSLAHVSPPAEDTPSTSVLPEEDTTSETLEELIALRKLGRRTGGIDLERLNAGEKKRRKKVDKEEVKGKDRMLEEADDGGKLIRTNNFTGQTNAVDIDKHMTAYIEEELRKRKGPNAAFDAAQAIKSLDPEDELYILADEHRIEKQSVQEGNVTLSAAMLTAIPEVDLGIDTRMKNIEDTEKAKRVLYEGKQANQAEDEFASDRFYRARRPIETDSDALAKARREASADQLVKPKPVDSGRRELATDDQVMDRFKKRQHR